MFPREGSSPLVAPPPIAQLLTDDIMAPFRHVSGLESKQFRGTLVDAFNDWLHLPPSATNEVKTIIEMLHNASLIVDDIEDSSNLRRGAPAAHRVYGMPLSLNAANTVYFLALAKLMRVADVVATEIEELAADDVVTTTGDAASDGAAWAKRMEGILTLPATAAYYRSAAKDLSLQLCEVFSSEMIELHHGQGLDIYWRDMVQCPTLAEYDEMVMKKTGGLFRLAIRIMIALSPLHSCPDTSAGAGGHPHHLGTRRPPDAGGLFATLIPLVSDIGILFQTLDDYLNVCSDTYHANKSFCEDLTEGKFSYPVIHCLKHQAERGEKTLLHILRQRTTDTDVKRYCVELMKSAGSLVACKERVEALHASVMGRIQAVEREAPWSGEGRGAIVTSPGSSAVKLVACIDRMLKMMHPL